MSSNRTDIRNTESIATVKEEARLAEWQKQIEERRNEAFLCRVNNGELI
ncbi:MAG: hypothetical protein ACI3XF_08215 [Eubacteriales bacterium]